MERLSTEGLVCVVGDLNAQLGTEAGPRGRNLQPSRLGALLLRMMSKCNLVAVDMLVTSTGPCYTFLRGERPISYIDHCLLSSTLIQHVNKCEVLDDHHLNFSDHLPVAVHLSSLSCAGTAHVTMTETAQSKVAWTRITSDDLQILYKDRVSVELKQLRREYGLTSDVVCVKEDILDSLIDRILWILRESAAKLPQAKYRKFLKPYWNKGLSECKKIVKAHWHEWVSNGRPRDYTNDIFASYKAAKRRYRNAIREAEREYELRWAQDVLKSSEMDHKAFWWMVNRRKRSRTGSVVSPIQTESGIKHELSEL